MRRRGVCGQPATVGGVGEREAYRRQEELRATKPVAKKAVVGSVSVARVAHDGVIDAMKVSSGLVATTGIQAHHYQCVSSRRIGTYRLREDCSRERHKMGPRRTGRRIDQRPLDPGGMVEVPSNEGQVRFGDVAPAELRGQIGGSGRAAGVNHDSRCPTIQAMNGVNPDSQLSLNDIQAVRRPGIPRVRVTQYPRRLQDNDEIMILVKNLQGACG